MYVFNYFFFIIECFICEEPFSMNEIAEHQRLVHPDDFSPLTVS